LPVFLFRLLERRTFPKGAAAMAATAQLQKIQEQRRSLKGRMDELRTKLLDPATEFSQEDKTNFEKVCSDFDSLGERMKLLQTIEERSKIDLDDELSSFDPIGRDDRSGKPAKVGADDEETRSKALAGWMSYQMSGECSDEQRQACRALGYSPEKRHLDIQLSSSFGVRELQRPFREQSSRSAFNAAMESRAPLTTTTASTGGDLIPTTLLRSLEVNMLAFGGMRQVSEIMRTSSGEPLNWPTADDTGNTGALIGESTNLDNSGAGGALPGFSLVSWGAYKFTSGAILVPFELLQDSVVDLPAVLGAMLGERLGRVTNTYYTTGTGTNQPNGIVTAAALGYQTTASSTAFDWTDLIHVIHSIDPAYRNGAGFMGHDSIKMAARLLKDDNNRPLWVDGVDLNAADSLMGYSFTTNQDMASSVASDAKVLLFGQLSKYKIRSVGSIRLYRLQELYRAKDQDGFIALIREDGNLLSAGTTPVKYLKMKHT